MNKKENVHRVRRERNQTSQGQMSFIIKIKKKFASFDRFLSFSQ